MIRTDKTIMLDPSSLDASTKRYPIRIDFPLKDGSNHPNIFLGEQVLEMRIGVIDALDDK